MIQFADPVYLLLLLPLLGLLFYRHQALWRTAKPLATLPYPALNQINRTNGRSLKLRLRHLPYWLRMVAMALLIVGLARPQGGQAREIVQGEGVALVLAVDISGTMAALDFAPQTRLEAVRAVLGEFVAKRPYNPTGLVIFAQEAYVQSPLTTHYETLLHELEQMRLAPEMGVADGTAIGLGLAHAASLLKDVEASSKAVILLTDGVNTVDDVAPMQAAEAARSLGIKVYTVGIGQDGAVPFRLHDVQGDAYESEWNSPLDEVTLAQIAEWTNGRYFRARTPTDLQQIGRSINQLEPSNIKIETTHQQAERMSWFVWPAFALLLLAYALQQTWLQKFP